MNQILFALSDGIFISIFSIIIVFLILFLIILVVNSLQQMNTKPKPIIKPTVEKIFSMDDIKDEDMMVAALVASIDYQEITHTDVKVSSIREIK